jgi:hypothetical protein
MPQIIVTPNQLTQIKCGLNKTLISMRYTERQRAPSRANVTREERYRERDVQ